MNAGLRVLVNRRVPEVRNGFGTGEQIFRKFAGTVKRDVGQGMVMVKLDDSPPYAPARRFLMIDVEPLD
jgi:hypothetical protein